MVLVATSTLHAIEPPVDPVIAELETQIQQGMEATILNDFDTALTTFSDIVERYPEHPVGYFYYAASLQAKMLDAEDFSRVSEFEKYLKLCREKSKEINRSGDKTWPLFFEGSAHLYSSFMNNKKGSMWSAYRDARAGVKALEKVIELDSTFYDAYLGVGSFKYWKSSKARSLTWLPFISDERELGIEMVQKAMAKGRFVPLVGADQLAWILLDNGDHEGALKLALDNHALYPNSRFFKWTLVSIYRKAGIPQETERLFTGLLQELRADSLNNHYNETICLLRLAEICVNRGEYLDAEAYLAELSALRLNKDMKKRTKNKYEEAAELRQRINRERAAGK